MIDIPKLPFIMLTVLATVLVLWAASALLSRLFVRTWIKRLLSSIGKNTMPHFIAALSANLPVAVQRYLHYAMKEGQPNIRYAILKARARFRHGADRPWFTVKATEYISGMEPGFVWDATLKHHAAWWRTAKLSFLHGRGHGHLKLFGAITLREMDGAETDRSMLFRFLSDLVWLPTGLLPTRALTWHAVDDSTATAVLTDEDTRVEATFHVNEVGQVDRIITNSKYRDHRSGFEQTQFTLLCKNYKEIEGIMVPTEVDFVWNLDDGDFEYGRFELSDIEYVYE